MPSKMRTEAKILVPAGTTSEPHQIEADIAKIVVHIIFTTVGTNSAEIETTLATNDEIQDNLTVDSDWVAWDDGIITENTKHLAAIAPNGIRLVNSGSSDCILRIRGNYGE